MLPRVSTNSAISSFSLTPDGTDAFVAWLSPSLGNLQAVSFIGGITASGRKDEAMAVAFRTTGTDTFDVYVAGYTSSPELAGIETGVSADDTYDNIGEETEGFVAWWMVPDELKRGRADKLRREWSAKGAFAAPEDSGVVVNGVGNAEVWLVPNDVAAKLQQARAARDAQENRRLGVR